MVITVRPRPSDDGRLKLADATQQVLGMLRVFESAGRSLDTDPPQAFDWRLERASVNLPLTVVAVAQAREPSADVPRWAKLAKHEAAVAFRALADGRSPPAWLDQDGTAALLRFVHLQAVSRPAPPREAEPKPSPTSLFRMFEEG